MRIKLLLNLAAAIWLLVIGTALGAPGEIRLVKVADPIGPGVAEFIKDSIATAEDEQAACVIIQLDTPGGLASAMREIEMAILASRVPVVVYVSPSGARAASAGVMITIAADIAAMAPGTNIGAAHPVGAGGREIEEKMSEKVVNDMVAHARSVAESKGRNAEWVEKAIRESAAITETEALEQNVIDLVATDLDDLIAQIDGREVAGKGTLDLEGAPRRSVEESLRTKVLKAISDPNVAFLLFLLGAAGLYFEFSNPGALFPGIIGGICLVLAIFAFQLLPVNYVGILLMVLAIVFFLLEIKVTSYGMLSVAGVVSLFLGALMLYEGDDPAIRISWGVLIPTVGLVSAFFVVVAGLAFRSQVSTTRTGQRGLVGKLGVVKQDIDPAGKVFVHGELWHATAGEPIASGAQVRVTDIEGLTLKVEPVESNMG
ncbi:MAG: nodulation protein NfeD [Desulfobacterales bacterium]|nr:nodulation protein NfeD [Desulfobacterales bacterium]